MKESSSKTYTIGTNSFGYPQRRNFAGLGFARFRFKKVNDICKVIDYAYFKLTKRSHPLYLNTFYDLGLNRVDLYHFFNTVSLGHKPWIVTFENELPRHNTDSRKLMHQLASKHCRKIIAISHNALNIEQYYLDKWPEYKTAINEKMIVLPPAQEKILDSIEEKDPGKEILFAFVGRAFFHKGGMEMLKSFTKLLRTFPGAQLTIVSDFTIINWLDTHVGEKEKQEALDIINAYPNNITLYRSLSQDEIVKLFCRSHVGLLPSYGETYGYSVLEAQACGCPVITPDTWAFSEFNSEEVGWLIDVPRIMDRNSYRADIATDHKRVLFSEALEKGLYKAMHAAASDRDAVVRKGRMALKQIAEKHSPLNNAAILEQIYMEAICS